jgi:ankyrin repeat protein
MSRRRLTLLFLAAILSGGLAYLVLAPREPPRAADGAAGRGRWLPRLDPGSDESLPELHRAAASGDTSELKKLLDAGASPSQADRDGWTALHWAVDKGHQKALRLLLSRGADPDASFPGRRGYRGWPSDVMGVDRRERDYKQGADTPLCVAVLRGRLHTARTLIDYGAEVDRRRQDGRTALMCAAHWRLPEELQFLIDSDADLTAVDQNGWTALHWAAQGHHPKCVEILLRHGADPNAASTDRFVHWGASHWSRWTYASSATPLHVVATAIESSVPAQRDQRATAEHIATAQALLAAGAHPEARDAADLTPLDYAKTNWTSDALAEVLQTGGKGD